MSKIKIKKLDLIYHTFILKQLKLRLCNVKIIQYSLGGKNIMYQKMMHCKNTLEDVFGKAILSGKVFKLRDPESTLWQVVSFSV